MGLHLVTATINILQPSWPRNLAKCLVGRDFVPIISTTVLDKHVFTIK